MADRALDRLVWVDCEMTGLDLRRDALIEIAALVTDSELRILDDGLDVVISAPEELLDGMERAVQEMHTASGLTELVRSSRITVQDAEQMVLTHLPALPDARPSRCAATPSPTGPSWPGTATRWSLMHYGGRPDRRSRAGRRW